MPPQLLTPSYSGLRDFLLAWSPRPQCWALLLRTRTEAVCFVSKRPTQVGTLTLWSDPTLPSLQYRHWGTGLCRKQASHIVKKLGDRHRLGT